MAASIRRLVVGISGASGSILGVRLLELLQPLPVETHLVITPAAYETLAVECQYTCEQVHALATRVYADDDLSAPIASGSFHTDGMVVIPCSIKSLSGIANSYTSNLLVRAADVTLKEGRSLVLVVRETPLHRGHLRLMSLAAEAGAVIFPPVPAFYTHPQSLDVMIDQLIGRVLKRLGIDNDYYQPWDGKHDGA